MPILNIGYTELALILIFLVYILLVLFCVIDILISRFRDFDSKLLWTLVIILIPLTGAIIYLTEGRGDNKPVSS